MRLDDMPAAIDTVEAAERWQRVLNQLNSGDMPPDDARQPEARAKIELLDALSTALAATRTRLADGGAAASVGLRYNQAMVQSPRFVNEETSTNRTPSPGLAEWVGRRGDKEPDPYVDLTPAERIELVWPITVTAWAFAGKPIDESRLRRDAECLVRRGR